MSRFHHRHRRRRQARRKAHADFCKKRGKLDAASMAVVPPLPPRKRVRIKLALKKLRKKR